MPSWQLAGVKTAVMLNLETIHQVEDFASPNSMRLA
jgi:hypothetical protein